MIFFEKSQPAPASLALEKLKAKGTYVQPDVIERLSEDFANKCYLCEQDDLTSINIEHLVSHRDDRDRKFDWNNLLLSCPHCNNIKQHRYDDILNCTIKTEEVEDSIKLKLDAFPLSEVEVIANRTDAKTHKTVELLKAVYNGTTAMKTKEAENLNIKLTAEINQFQQLLLGYMQAKKHNDDEEVENFRRKLKYSLHKNAPFTSFKRWIIRESDKRNAEFGNLFEVGE